MCLSCTRKTERIANNGHRGLLEFQVEKKRLQDEQALTGMTMVQLAFIHSNSNAKV
jgi:hypothetical protein